MTQLMDPPATARTNGNGGGNNGGGALAARPARASAIAEMAARFNVDASKMMDLLKATVIKGTNSRQATNEEVAAFVIVANQYGLNPFTREIHAFADGQRGIVPIVGIDGWAHIVNAHEQFDGCEFEEQKDSDGDLGITCTMYVKNRARPIRITEWLSECKRNTAPWNTMKRRMLRHKAFMQCARIAFSISGIYDDDEARDIIQGGPPSPSAGATATDRLNEQILTNRPVSEGQQFVPDPEAALAAAREAQAPVIEGEVIDRNTGEVEATDVSGADAEPPPQNETAAVAEQELREALGQDPEQLRKVLRSAAGNMSRADFEKAYLAYLLRAAKKGKEHELTMDQRMELYHAFKDGRINLSGQIAPAAKQGAT